MIINAVAGTYTIYDDFDHSVTVSPEEGETNVRVTITPSQPVPESVEVSYEGGGVYGWAGSDVFTDVDVVAEYILKGVSERQEPILVKRISDIPPPSEVILTAFHPSRMQQIVYTFTVTAVYDFEDPLVPRIPVEETESKTFTITILNDWARGKKLVEKYNG